LVRQGDQINLLTDTAPDGQFYFLDLMPGKYSIEVSLPTAGTRYGTAKANLTVSLDDRKDTGKIKRSSTDISLPPTAIRGQVTDVQRKALGMAKIQILGGASTFSDREGHYLIPGLEVWMPPPGAENPSQKPLVRISAQGFQPQSIGVSLTQGEVTELDVVLAAQPPPSG
jgi:hypothetical protein